MFVDEENGGGSFSFGEIARQEASRIGASLESVQDLLHQPPTTDTVMVEDVEPANVTEEDEDDGGFSGFHHYRRYESAGYDAHSDCVDLTEVLSWQSAFPYLRITGTQIPSSSSGNKSDTTNDSSDEGIEFVLSSIVDLPANNRLTNDDMMVISAHDTEPSLGGGPCDLIIEGRKIVIGYGGRGVGSGTRKHEQNTGTSAAAVIVDDDHDHDHDDVMHGVLEEVITIDVESTALPRKKDDNVDNVSLPPSPQTSKQEEIVSLLMDVVWPEVVETMRPLVCAVVKLSRERGITYEIDDDAMSPAPAVEQGGGDRWIESDDEF